MLLITSYFRDLTNVSIISELLFYFLKLICFKLNIYKNKSIKYVVNMQENVIQVYKIYNDFAKQKLIL